MSANVGGSGCTESYVTISGCKIRLLRGGQGASLLYLHGAGGGGVWLPFLADLARKYDVIAPEHPGFGLSETPVWLDNIQDMAFFYLDLIEQLGLEHLHLVGTSLGGWIAAEIAIRDCTRLLSMTLVAPAGIHVKGVAKGDIFLWSPEQLTQNLFHDPKFAAAALARPVTPEDEDAQMKNRFMTARLGWQPRLYDPMLMKWLHRARVPTKIIWGEQDKVIPAAYAAPYAALIPGASVEMIAECGHLPHIEQKDRLVSAIVAHAAGGRP
jgi:pimeloyl-ACP methyl ester carboxylesterase